MNATALYHCKNQFSTRAWSAYFIALMLSNPPRLFATLQDQRWYRQMLQDWLKEAIAAGATNCLEIGCGPGVFSRSLASQGLAVSAVDNSKSMINYAKRQRRQEQSNPDFRLGNAYQLDFPPQQFDLVAAASLINVTPQAVTVIKEMLRVSHPNGLIACLTPSPDMSPANAEQYIKTHRLKNADAAALRLWSSRARKLSRQQLLEYFQAAGARNIRIKPGLDGMVLYSYAQGKPA